MITRIEIDGFKSFLDFRLDVPPTLVMLGPNGAGKSNLLDALRLASGIVRNGLAKTLADDRRLPAAGLFHRGGDGGEARRDRLTIEVGMVVPSVDGPLPLRLRLAVALRQREGERREAPVLVHSRNAVWVSSLQSAEWVRRIGLPDEALPAMRAARERFLARTGAEIAPVGQGFVPGALLNAPAEEDGDDPFGLFRETRGLAELLTLTARECLGWEPLQLRPEVMRQLVPASPEVPLGADGSGLAMVVARLMREAPDGWRRFVSDGAGLIEGLRDIRPQLLERRNEYDFEAEFEHTGWMPPELLSDGTLRILGLLAATADPLRPGTLCVEELENGMHPGHVADLVRRLRRRAGDMRESGRRGYRQLLTTTHSPALLAALRTDFSGSLVFMEQVHRTDPGDRTVSRVTRALPLLAGDDVPEESVSPEQVARMLRRLGQEAA